MYKKLNKKYIIKIIFIFSIKMFGPHYPHPHPHYPPGMYPPHGMMPGYMGGPPGMYPPHHMHPHPHPYGYGPHW